MDQIKIAELRHDEGMTQEALGQKIGVTNKTISRWETGVYMPDIEMLKLLSDVFHVSINKLLCGEQLTDANFREKADINIISAFKESSFSIKERTDFWKQKWIKEHMALIIICIGVVIRNRMMTYIEDRIYMHNNSGAK